MLAAVFAVLAALCGWLFVLLPPGGNPRGSPVFWLLTVPLLCWTTPLLGFRAWAVNTVGIALLVAPALALGALLTAEHRHADHPLFQGQGALDSPGGMSVVVGVTVVFALAGVIALRRSSLPGGARPPTYLTPGTLPAGLHPVPPELRTAMAIGSLTLSGALINGVFFVIVALLDVRSEALGPLWPAAIPVVIAGPTLVLQIRGGRRIARRDPHASQDLIRGWHLGASGTGLMLGLIWLWPTDPALKLAMSLFMAPMALAAAWAVVSASRRLRAKSDKLPPR
ncbi:hypothetical protein ACLBX9_12130 [Methylobacterium sp. A49B]